MQSRLTSSSFTCQLISIMIPTLIIHYSFTPGSKPTFQQILSTLILFLPGLPFTITGADRTYHASRFIFSSLRFFYFSRVADWARYTSAFCCTLNTQYRNVSYRIDWVLCTAQLVLQFPSSNLFSIKLLSDVPVWSWFVVSEWW